MNFRALSIRTKIVVPLLAVALLSLGALAAFISYFQFRADERIARDLIRVEAVREAETTTRAIEAALTTTRANAVWVGSALAGGTFDRAATVAALKATLEGTPAITGIYLGLEPGADGQEARHAGGALGDKDGRALLYVFRSAGRVTAEPTPPNRTGITARSPSGANQGGTDVAGGAHGAEDVRPGVAGSRTSVL